MAKHSFSKIKAFETCPRQYHAVHVLKAYPRVETSATIYGTELHKHAENFIAAGTPVPEGFKFLQPTLDAVARMSGRKFAELQMAVDEKLQPCAFDSKDYWLRGIADVVVLDDDNFTGRVLDWKTGGNRYPDTDQLMVMSLMVLKHQPHIRSMSGGLVFVLKGTVTKYKMHRDDEHALWWQWRERVAKLDAALHHDNWPAKPSGLCREYCPVTTCEHCGRR